MIEQGNKLYANRHFKKHLLTKPNTLNRFLEHSPHSKETFAEANAHFDPISGLNLRKALAHLRQEHKYEMILVEAGASTTIPCYSETH